jgi:hypothetical protein
MFFVQLHSPSIDTRYQVTAIQPASRVGISAGARTIATGERARCASAEAVDPSGMRAMRPMPTDPTHSSEPFRQVAAASQG